MLKFTYLNKLFILNFAENLYYRDLISKTASLISIFRKFVPEVLEVFILLSQISHSLDSGIYTEVVVFICTIKQYAKQKIVKGYHL